MKVTLMPCAQCHYPHGPDCEFCERYFKWLIKVKPEDVVITEIVDSDQAENFTCPHCAKWFSVG
ncbi:MAG: hypothetical protein FH756_12165 [Firmicutes bacterium]|nr:hypothetical protein [Bacillota bacterium]